MELGYSLLVTMFLGLLRAWWDVAATEGETGRNGADTKSFGQAL